MIPVGVVLLPVAVFVCLRLLAFGRLTAFLAAGAVALVATRIPDRLALGIGLGLLFLGLAYRSYSRDRNVWLPAIGLAAAAQAAGAGAGLWAALSTTYLLYTARKPVRTLFWLATVASGALALLGFAALAHLAFPPLGLPLLAPRVLGLAFTGAVIVAALAFVSGRRTGGPDHRVLYLAHAILVGGALAVARPAIASIPALPAGSGSGAALLAAGILAFALSWRSLRKATRPATDPVDLEKLDCEIESPAPRWGGIIPVILVIALLLSRLIVH